MLYLVSGTTSADELGTRWWAIGECIPALSLEPIGTLPRPYLVESPSSRASDMCSLHLPSAQSLFFAVPTMNVCLIRLWKHDAPPNMKGAPNVGNDMV